MSERLYFQDPACTEFSARVVEYLQWDGQPAVVLDRSAFYPTGGGQPHDEGCLNDTAVLDVVAREGDGAVIHVLAEPLQSDAVEGRVDRARRFDLMQQHTGQHILSAAFVETAGANTVGFHLSDDYATVDLDRAPLDVQDLDEAEARANRIVFEDHTVEARFVPDREVPLLPLRKPLAVGHNEPVRVVEIPGFDCSACGGTHVTRTGAVGLIKITRNERRGTETRIEFLCGGRALADYGAKNRMLMGLAQEFTIAHREIPAMVHRLAEDLKETRRELRRSRDARLDAEASALWYQARELEGIRVVRAHFHGRSLDDLKHLAQRIIGHPKTVALLAVEGSTQEKSYFTFARSDDLSADVGMLVRQACEAIGGRGGGRPNFAQGGGPQGDQVASALDAASQSLADSIGVTA